MKNLASVEPTSDIIYSKPNQSQPLSHYDIRTNSASEACSVHNIEIRNTKTKKSNRTQFSVSKSANISAIMNTQRELAKSKSLRICGLKPFFGSDSIKFSKMSDSSVRTEGLFVCKSANCAYCSNYKSRLVFERIHPVVEAVKNKIFITLTTSKVHDLRDLDKRQKTALKATLRSVRRYFKKHLNQEFGYIRSRETTFEPNNPRGLYFHPHFHLLIINNDDDFDSEFFESLFREKWAQFAESNGLIVAQKAQKFININSDASAPISHYLVKGISYEMTANAIKESHQGISLFTLLAEASNGCSQSIKVYQEFSEKLLGGKAVQSDEWFLNFEKGLDQVSDKEDQVEDNKEEPEEATLVRELELGLYSFKVFNNHFREHSEDFIRHLLETDDMSLFSSFSDLFSPKLEGIISKESESESEFIETYIGLIEEFIHIHQIDFKSIPRRKLFYKRDMVVISS